MIKKFRRGLIILSALFIQLNAVAAEPSVKPGIYKQVVNQPMQKVYPAVYQALEDVNFYVVFEPFISKSISRFAEKWGDDYNQNKLDSIRSMVFCNGWYANKVSNADPDMLALCPLSLSLYEKSGKTVVAFARPSIFAGQSTAGPVLQEIESAVINAIKTGIENIR